jgi:hypothetical protein
MRRRVTICWLISLVPAIAAAHRAWSPLADLPWQADPPPGSGDLVNIIGAFTLTSVAATTITLTLMVLTSSRSD